MPNYVTKSLQKFQHPTPSRSQYAHHQWTRLNYGATNQLENTLDTSSLIPEERKFGIQKIVGNFLYYANTVDCNMLPSINSIAKKQAHTTHHYEAAITHYLDYSATNTTTVVQFKASDTVIHIDSDASYLSKP